MPAKRIFTQPGQPIAAKPAGPLGASGGVPAVVMVVINPEQQAAWRQIYLLAEERARQALAPPRHHERLFSVWN
jgi:hypothetical protein